MPLNFNRAPAPGETRDCTDPWKFMIVRANGDVCLCCRTPPVGNVKTEALAMILDGDAAQRIRRELLTGELSQDCVVCSERGTTTPDELREKVVQLFEDGADEIAELRIENRKLKDARGDLVRERTALQGHVKNLESERDALRRHVENLDRDRAGLQSHVKNLEAERPQLVAHIANLERMSLSAMMKRFMRRIAALPREVRSRRRTP